MTAAAQQELEFERVSKRIAELIIKFARHVVANERRQFRMEELLRYVSDRAQVAPDSPGRILRDLKRRGALDYKVINRSASLYEVTWINGQLLNDRGEMNA